MHILVVVEACFSVIVHFYPVGVEDIHDGERASVIEGRFGGEGQVGYHLVGRSGRCFYGEIYPVPNFGRIEGDGVGGRWHPVCRLRWV